MKIAYRLSIILLAGLLAGLSWQLLADNANAPIAHPIASPYVASPAAAKITAPPLVNPVSPLAFGARCDGKTNDSAAFQAALNAGDVKVPPGICVINRTVKITVSHRHLECSPGTTLKQTNPYAQSMFEIESPEGGALTGDSIANCTFVGSNTVAPRFFLDDARHYNIPVETRDRVSNFTLIRNSFSRFFGQAMFQTYGAVDGGSGDIIAYNRFQSCGYYGAVFVAHRNGYIGHNVLIDCAVGVENDNPKQMSGGNIIEYNRLTAVHGYGAPDMGAAVLLTGGTAGDANYSTNIVRYNEVTGADSTTVSTLPSIIWQKASGGAARYLQNSCGKGCKVIQ
ncbi:MAG: hypothetical protein QOI13_3401 [Paraburkholderia sp.]|nr:hypothetical protein [Paraburkholderia sp.]